MKKALQAEQGSAVHGRVFERVSEWYSVEETVVLSKEGSEGKASIGGKVIIAEASGGIVSKKMKSSKKTAGADRTIAALVDRFNSCIQEVEKASERRLVFVVDDIDQVQEASSVNSTLICVTPHRIDQLRMYLRPSRLPMPHRISFA